MTPAAIIRAAEADGVNLELSSAGTIKAAGDQVAVNRWVPVLREHKPAILAALAHPDRSGVTPEFAARLSPEDLNDITAGDIPLGIVQAFEQVAVAREAVDLKEFPNGPHQNDRLRVTRAERGSTGWEWMSSTPAAGSPERREA